MDHTRWYEPQSLPLHHEQPPPATAAPKLCNVVEPPAAATSASTHHRHHAPPQPPNFLFPSYSAAAASFNHPPHLQNAGELPHPAHYRQIPTAPPHSFHTLSSSPSGAAFTTPAQYPYHSYAPKPASYQQPPAAPPQSFDSLFCSSTEAVTTAAQFPYHPYDQSLDPNSRVDAAAPARSRLYQAPHAGETPEVDGRVSIASGPRTWDDGHVARCEYYSPIGPELCHRGLTAAGDARGFSAIGRIGEYGVDPVAYGNILGRPPSFSLHFNNVTYPRNRTQRKKKHKKVAKVTQSAYCKVCKVECNGQEVLRSHKRGKKHRKNLEKLKESFTLKPVMVPIIATENKETLEASKEKTAGEPTDKRLAPTDAADLETRKRRLLEEGAAADAMRVCIICNIVCNSEVVFKFHMAGRKHATMVKKQAAAPVSIS